MKKRFYYSIGAVTVIALLVVVLLISQVLISSRIKKEIINWCDNHGIEFSDFNCRVNLFARNIALGGLTLKKEENNLQIERANISFYLLDFLSKKHIRLIHIDKADITFKHFLPFYLIFPANNPGHNPGTSVKNPLLIDELRIDNLILKTELPGDSKIPDIHLESSFKNIGTDRNTTFIIKTTYNSSFVEIKGDFKFDNWKEYLTYQVQGKGVSLGILNVFEEGFLSPELQKNLLSLMFKDVFSARLRGKIDVIGKGEIKEQTIDSQLKFSLSELSCDTENERVKAFIKRMQDKDKIEVIYEIGGTLTNPHFEYDIVF